MQATLRASAILLVLPFVLATFDRTSVQAQQTSALAQQAQFQAQATAQGELVSVDAKASTLTIRTAAAEMEFRYTAQTKVVGAQKGVAGLATMKGSRLTVEYQKQGETNIATSIEVHSEQPPGR